MFIGIIIYEMRMDDEMLVLIPFNSRMETYNDFASPFWLHHTKIIDNLCIYSFDFSWFQKLKFKRMITLFFMLFFTNSTYISVDIVIKIFMYV